MLSISLPNFKSQFDKNIVREIRKEIAARMPKVIDAVQERLGVELFDAIQDSPTWRAVKGGSLRGELGIANVASLDNILLTWADGVEVTYEQNKEFGILRIGMIQADYSDVLSLPESSFVSSSARTGNTSVIEWLRWLLLESTAIIVSNYSFVPKNNGRTGLGIMIETGRGWRIPQQYAGSATDNFATRSLQNIGSVIDKVVEEEVNRRF